MECLASKKHWAAKDLGYDLNHIIGYVLSLELACFYRNQMTLPLFFLLSLLH